MQQEELEDLVRSQREHFLSGLTRPIQVRKAKLTALGIALKQYEAKLLEALRADLGKGSFEAYTTEIGIVLQEIGHAKRHLNSWASPKRVFTHPMNWPGSSRIYPEPFGVSLILAPWNYPVQLTLVPLVAALAGGNTAVLKPSELAPNSSQVMADLVAEWFEPEAIAVVQGDSALASTLLDLRWDKIFFTGSTRVGKIVMAKAAEQLCPVTLELGGKSPVIVDRSAKLDYAAEKIVWGKFVNAGQTCVAPDYVLVSGDDRAEELLALMQEAVARFYGEDPLTNPDYPRIVNRAHFERIRGFLKAGGIAEVRGGALDEAALKIAPTFLYPAPYDHPAMAEEIFGPVLPIIAVDGLDSAFDFVAKRPTPLAAYLFTESTASRRRFLAEVSSGNGGINTVLLQVASSGLPFGGAGPSGMGAYHGKAGFDSFTRPRSIMQQSTLVSNRAAYPGSQPSLDLVRRFMK